MKPVPFDYVLPETLDELLEVLALGNNAKILAGGQSLVPMLNMRLARPDMLISLRRIPGLEGIEDEGQSLRVGAMVVQERFRRAVSGREGFDALSVGMEHIGHPQTRSTGTVAGSIAHADPSSELPLLLQVYRGSATIMGPSGLRNVEARDLFLFPYTTLIEPQEVVVSTSWPKPLRGTGSAFMEISRRRGDFALVAVACQIRINGERCLEDGVLGAAGVAGTPISVELPSHFKGQTLSEDVAQYWIQSLDPLLDPPNDLEASSGLRRHLVHQLGYQTVVEAERRAGGNKR